MQQHPRPFSAEHPSLRPLPPQRPFDVVVVGAGRVGGSFARALERAGHRVLGELRRDDDPGAIADANVVVIAVPDDSIRQAAGVVARMGRPGAVVMHTCGLAGLDALEACGALVAAVHPAVPVATNDQVLDGTVFGVTCPDDLRAWVAGFVGDLGGQALFISEEQRPLYHAALSMSSNFAVALAGDAAALLGGHELIVPLMRATVDNIQRLGPAAALTGPVVRGDAGTLRAHLAALPQELIESYVANARRALALAVESGRLGPEAAERVREALEEAVIR